MGHPSTHFEREAEDQSLLHFSGTLDRSAAEELYEKAAWLTMQGYRQIRVNMQKSGLVLAEGVLALAEKSQKEEGSGCELWLTRLSDELVRSLQLYGLAVQKRMLCLPLPCKAMPLEAGFVLKKCNACGATLRVRQKGAHLCPRCGSKLKVA